MRPLIVLALAPILALGLALGAGTVVPDKAPKATLKPQAIVWDDRVFTSPTKFARWLGARDKSYQVWVQRHPGATWFHKVRASGTKAALAAPPAKSAKSDGGAGTDTGLVILVGLGGLVLGGAIMRILPAVTAGSVDRRRRALRSPPTPASVGVPRRLALPAPKPAPPRPATVYAPPRVYPTPAAAASEPARVVPLYIPPPPEPEVEPIVEPDRVAATAHEPQPVVAPTVLQPEPQPQTFVAPAPAAPEPERKPVVNGEPFVAAIAQPEAPVHVDEPEEEAPAEPDASSAAEPVETTEAEPAPPPEPLAVAEVQPAIEPEPVELPKLPGPPEEEPSLEPAAEAVPAAEPEEAEIEPEPEPKPEPIIERPARTTVMPASAPAGTDWHMCEIALWEGYVKSQFYARVMTPEGKEFALACSPLFRVKNPFARDEVARSAHVHLAQQLLEGGWKPDGRGKYWWELRFTLDEAKS